ncbi:diguanylate cyclase (GGDEF) domain-containing protein [gamma proteobacterium HIMB55]|nr:diguanylate cyclase (GGDEF) domain-containing protein [gamma proteobacterium HIMB55]
MRDLFSNASQDQPRAKLSVYEPSLRDSFEFRDLMRKAVLYLSTLLTFGAFLNVHNRGEPHIEMWLTLAPSCVALIAAARLSPSSRHLFAGLHLLMAIMVLTICVQVVHGIRELLLWTLPFYLIWIMMLPTTVVAIFGLTVSLITTFLADDHSPVPTNYMLALASAMVVHFAKEQLRNHLHLAASDALTGALNRRYLLTQLSARRADFTRDQRFSSLMLFDVDGLKEINDRFGHRFGDDTLKFIVEIIQQRVRATDALFRIGGDEFALILVGAKAHAALNVANEIRGLIRDKKPSELPDFSISFGVCAVDDSSSPEDWLDSADEALYAAKSKGGDTAQLAA